MKTVFTLYVTRYGHVRLTKGAGQIKPGEVAFGVELDIPTSVFQTPNRSISITVPEADLTALEIEASTIVFPIPDETEELTDED